MMKNKNDIFEVPAHLEFNFRVYFDSLDHVNEGVILYNQDGTILKTNQACLDIGLLGALKGKLSV